MKKLICLILAAVMTAGLLCACGRRDTEEDTGPNLIFSTEPPEITEASVEPTEQTTVPATFLEETVKITLPTIVPTEETKPDDSGDRRKGETGSKKSDETGTSNNSESDNKKSDKTDNKETAHVHSYKSTVTAPTCTQAGYTTYTCKTCGHSYQAKEKAALGHSFRTAETAPTCTEKGYTTYACTVCAYKYRENIPAAGHSWSKWIVTAPATESAEGEEIRTCSICRKTETREIDRLPSAHTHKYTAAVTAPTCTEKGYTTYTCSCGDSYKSDATPATGHSWGEWKVTIPATEEAEGEESRTCSACGKAETRKIDRLPAVHTHTYTAAVTAPTCTEEGYTTYTCSCGDSYKSNATPATGHSWGKWQVTSPATEEAEGEETRICGACGKSETRKLDRLPAVHTHTYTAAVTAPTCTEEGYTTYTCSCGDSYKSDAAPALGHTWGQWQVTTPATEDTEGEETRECSACGKTKTRKTDKLAHEHKYEVTETAAPACTEKGQNTYTCSCGDSYTEDIPATGHTWGEWSRTKEPTKEEEGEEARECSVCGEKETRPVEKIPGDPEPDVSSSYGAPEIIDIINEYRKAEGLGTLSYDSANEDFANTRAAEICISFSHDRLDGTSVLYSSMRLGLYAENIAMTWGDYQHVVDLWMDSKGHRENMMESSYTKAVAARNGSYYVLLLG